MPQVYVGIGSNIEREIHIRRGVADLRKQFGELQLSSVYESEAVGFDGQPFYNLVAGFETDERIEQLSQLLRQIEDRHGRVRSDARYSARTLDIDLLLYDDMVARTANFHVPRDEIIRYAFVLQPLAEVAPDLRHPETGTSMASLWQQFDKDSQRLHAVEFVW